MNTKKSSKMEKSPKSTTETAILPNLPMQLIIRSNHIRSRGQTYLGITKSWLTTSRRCNNKKQPQNPQLALLTDTTRCMWKGYRDTSLVNPLRWCSSPPPGYPDNFFKLSRSYSYTIVFPGGNKRWPPSTTLTLILTDVVSVPAVVVKSLTYIGGTYKLQWMTFESTMVDPYDTDNKFMKFTNGVISCDGNKFYALSSQGCLVVMEEANEEQLTIKGICRTRAVPSVNAKYFKEYMFASKGEIFLVFLIYRKSDVAVGIEVYRVEHVGDTTFDLVKVDKLQGRVLFLDKECCLWVDSEELGCKSDCIYFTGGLSGNNGWWMYDMKNESISDAWNKRTRINGHGVSITEYEPVLFGVRSNIL